MTHVGAAEEILHDLRECVATRRSEIKTEEEKLRELSSHPWIREQFPEFAIKSQPLLFQWQEADEVFRSLPPVIGATTVSLKYLHLPRPLQSRNSESR